MKPPRSDKSFIDRLEVHIDTIVNFFIIIISLFETILNISISHHQKKYQLLPPPPPPMSHLKNFSSLILVNLYTPPPKILQPPRNISNNRKKSQPLDTNSTTQRKCYPSVEYPPPQKKKTKIPTTRKNRTIAISEENVISFRITRSLLIHSYTLSKQSQPSKRNFNPSQKNFNPPPPKYLYSSGTISTTRKKS